MRMSISLFESPQEALFKVVEVNGFSYRVSLGFILVRRLKGQKYMVGGLPITTNISPLLRILI